MPSLYQHPPKRAPVTTLAETVIMLVVLALIDVVMISNLLIMVIMVIVGGYETFVSRLDFEGHRDRLSHVNASVRKVKRATAIIDISSIHLLNTSSMPTTTLTGC